jgi:multicomponent Na+:H+ antiporter subunit E
MFTVLSPDMHLKPAIIALPLDIKSDVEVTLLANMITLTPGTLSMDLSDDHSILYVHVVSVGDPEDTRQELKTGFETLVYEVFKW